jgi:hypothetical protein
MMVATRKTMRKATEEDRERRKLNTCFPVEATSLLMFPSLSYENPTAGPPTLLSKGRRAEGDREFTISPFTIRGICASTLPGCICQSRNFRFLRSNRHVPSTARIRSSRYWGAPVQPSNTSNQTSARAKPCRVSGTLDYLINLAVDPFHQRALLVHNHTTCYPFHFLPVLVTFILSLITRQCRVWNRSDCSGVLSKGRAGEKPHEALGDEARSDTT